jgi:hypothetical protein
MDSEKLEARSGELFDSGLGSEEGQRFFRENKLRDRCRFLTVQAARILAGFLP